MATVEKETHDALKGISAGDVELLAAAVDLREAQLEHTGLDSRTFGLVKIAALVALDAPPASYAWQVPNALADGATPNDVLGVLRAIAPQVGGPRIVAAAAEAHARARHRSDRGLTDAAHAPASAPAGRRGRRRRVHGRQAPRGEPAARVRAGPARPAAATRRRRPRPPRLPPRPEASRPRRSTA